MKDKKITTSKHYNNKRYKREKFINKHFGGDGNIIDSFVVDRHHKDGLEIHQLTDNGIIVIRNKNSGCLITKLIARPHQIKRYYEDTGREPPKNLIELAQWHRDLGYNR